MNTNTDTTTTTTPRIIPLILAEEHVRLPNAKRAMFMRVTEHSHHDAKGRRIDTGLSNLLGIMDARLLAFTPDDEDRLRAVLRERGEVWIR